MRIVGPGAGPVGVGALYAPIIPTTDQPQALRAPILTPAPIAGRVDSIGASIVANLLVSTLAAVAMFPPGQQVQASAPQVKYSPSAEQKINTLPASQQPQPRFLAHDTTQPQLKYNVYAELPVRPLTLGIQSAPNPVALFASAPEFKYNVQVEPQQRSIALGIPSPPAPPQTVLQVTGSAPAIKAQVQTDFFQNLSGTTLAAQATVIEPRNTIYTSLQPKFQVIADQFVNTLVLGYPLLMPGWIDFEQVPQAKYQPSAEQQINRLPLLGAPPAPSVTTLQLTVSAPAIKWQANVDQPVRPITLGIQPNPAVVQLSASAPQVAFQNQTEPPPRPITLGIQVNPAPVQISASAPYPPYQVQNDYFQNLSNTLQFVAFPPPPQTVLTITQSAPITKYQTQVDYFQNVTVLGIPTPPVVSLKDTHDGGTQVVRESHYKKILRPKKLKGQVIERADLVAEAVMPLTANKMPHKVIQNAVTDDDEAITIYLTTETAEIDHLADIAQELTKLVK
jgi:hypothetical protein